MFLLLYFKESILAVLQKKEKRSTRKNTTKCTQISSKLSLTFCVTLYRLAASIYSKRKMIHIHCLHHKDGVVINEVMPVIHFEALAQRHLKYKTLSQQIWEDFHIKKRVKDSLQMNIC